jgi:dihydrofolate synthase/folylpolyglutamate synthase
MSAYIPQERIYTFESLQQAAQAAILASQPHDLLLVCGSFHTIGETLLALTLEPT